MNVAVPANVLSLCAGGGGLDLGLRLAVPDARTVCYVENEVTACGVLVSNMEAERLDPAPIWTDLLTFDGKPWRGVVDWVIGGYPCQPFSNAGKRLGADDPRHLWPHVARIVADVAPRFCFFENVGAHLRLGFREVARDLQGMGYTVAATLSTASEVGAPHGRERLFILAYREGIHGGVPVRGRGSLKAGTEPRGSGAPVARRDQQHAHGGGNAGQEWRPEPPDCGVDVADTECSSGSPEPREQHQAWAEVTSGAGDRASFPPAYGDTEGWRRMPSRLEPAVCRGAYGARGGLGRSDQLHILGNGVVPQQAAYALRLLFASIGRY